MKLSIIVPAYNSEKTIIRCLKSIQDQDLHDFECIVIDDGSTDNTLSVVKEFIKYDKRFYVHSKRNEGVAKARNLGIKLATGEWTAFIDSDDTITHDRFTKTISIAEKNDVDFIQNAFNIYNNGTPGNPWVWTPGLYTIEDETIFSTSNLDIGHSCSKTYKTDIIKKYQFPDCDFCEDLIFNMQIFFEARKLLVIEDKLYNYYREPGTLAKSRITPERKLKLVKATDDLCRKWSYKYDYYKQGLRDFVDDAFIRHGYNNLDMVVLYVNNQDKYWQALYEKYSRIERGIASNEENGKYRYANSDDFKYVFRGLEKNVQNLGIIHLVVMSESQVPTWLDSSKIHVIIHEDFMPRKLLPTFNSSTIEMYIWNLFGVSERFIYGNDDMYPIYTLKEHMLFEGDKIKLGFIKNDNYNEIDRDSIWFNFFENSRKLAAKNALNPFEAPEGSWYAIPHTIVPYRKSFLKNAYYQNKTILDASCTRFREKKNFNQYYYAWWCIYNNFSTNTTYRFVYEPVQRINPRRVAKEITNEGRENRPFRVICLNDTMDSPKDTQPLKDALAKVFPSKSKYER